jgi:hypothetical protein
MPCYQLTDHPTMIPASEYGEAVEELAQRAKNTEGFLSLYSIGGVSAPGISDLDVVLVLEDGFSVREDLRPTTAVGRQLFIHSLYGTSRSLFLEAQSYTCYAPYRLKCGQDLLAGHPALALDTDIRRQIAREYLLRLTIGLKLQHLQRMLRVRSILLNANGIGSDLEVLTPGNTPALQLLGELQVLRRSWFEKQTPPESAFVDWFGRFLKWLRNSSALTKFSFPRTAPIRWAGTYVSGGERRSDFRNTSYARPSFAPCWGVSISTC